MKGSVRENPLSNAFLNNLVFKPDRDFNFTYQGNFKKVCIQDLNATAALPQIESTRNKGFKRRTVNNPASTFYRTTSSIKLSKVQLNLKDRLDAAESTVPVLTHEIETKRLEQKIDKLKPEKPKMPKKVFQELDMFQTYIAKPEFNTVLERIVSKKPYRMPPKLHKTTIDFNFMLNEVVRRVWYLNQQNELIDKDEVVLLVKTELNTLLGKIESLLKVKASIKNFSSRFIQGKKLMLLPLLNYIIKMGGPDSKLSVAVDSMSKINKTPSKTGENRQIDFQKKLKQTESHKKFKRYQSKIAANDTIEERISFRRTLDIFTDREIDLNEIKMLVKRRVNKSASTGRMGVKLESREHSSTEIPKLDLNKVKQNVPINRLKSNFSKSESILHSSETSQEPSNRENEKKEDLTRNKQKSCLFVEEKIKDVTESDETNKIVSNKEIIIVDRDENSEEEQFNVPIFTEETLESEKQKQEKMSNLPKNTVNQAERYNSKSIKTILKEKSELEKAKTKENKAETKNKKTSSKKLKTIENKSKSKEKKAKSKEKGNKLKNSKKEDSKIKSKLKSSLKRVTKSKKKVSIDISDSEEESREAVRNKLKEQEERMKKKSRYIADNSISEIQEIDELNSEEENSVVRNNPMKSVSSRDGFSRLHSKSSVKSMKQFDYDRRKSEILRLNSFVKLKKSSFSRSQSKLELNRDLNFKKLNSDSRISLNRSNSRSKLNRSISKSKLNRSSSRSRIKKDTQARTLKPRSSFSKKKENSKKTRSIDLNFEVNS